MVHRIISEDPDITFCLEKAKEYYEKAEVSDNAPFYMKYTLTYLERAFEYSNDQLIGDIINSLS